jgi:hypothetical protein
MIPWLGIVPAGEPALQIAAGGILYNRFADGEGIITRISSGWPVSRILSSVEFSVYALRCLPVPRACAIISLCSRPGTQTRRAASCPCLALLPAGVAWPPALLQTPVVSYTTFSPLPPAHPPKGRGRRFVSVALIRQISPSRGFPGAVPCGVRTFLSPSTTLRASPSLHLGAATARPA